MSGNIITLDQELIHTELKDLVKNSVEETLNAMLDAEADRVVNADKALRASGTHPAPTAPEARRTEGSILVERENTSRFSLRC